MAIQLFQHADSVSLILIGATLGAALVATIALLFQNSSHNQSSSSTISTSTFEHPHSRQSKVSRWQPPQIVGGFAGCVGNTPLIYLRTLSEATGCTILGKAEFLNPGGSSKDRIAREIISKAQESGSLPKGGTVIEGSSGSTGISMSLMAASVGCRCEITMPSDQAVEKSNLMELFGADVERVTPAAISNDRHYSRLAESRSNASNGQKFYANQFENLDNVRSHRMTTGPEIWQQTGGNVDAFVMSAGTGGSLTGVGSFLKEKNKRMKVVLADPTGSVLYYRVKHGVAYTPQQAEKTLKRVRVDTITEGIGIDRLTRNFTEYEDCIDDAFRIEDQEAVNMAWHLLRNEGLFVGSSSGLNCMAAMRVARELGPGHTVVTVLCDSGSRHLTKLYNLNFLEKNGLHVDVDQALR
jgi:cysteine synthase A